MSGATSFLRGLGALAKAQLKETLRSKTALFWAFAFPLVFLFVFGFVFGGGNPENTTFLMPGLLTISVMSGSFMGVSMRMVMARESGTLRRYRVTPVSALAIVLSFAVVAVVTLTLTLFVQLGVARLVFKITLAGSPLLFGAVCLAGFLAFVPLGLFVGSVARDTRSAPALTNLIFFPMMFLSGAALPLFLLPNFLKSVSRLLPATYLVDALQGVMVRGDGLRKIAAPLLVLAATALVGVALNALLFRWESDEPVNKKKLLMALSGLAAVFVGAALLAPELMMSHAPGSKDAAAGESRGQGRRDPAALIAAQREAMVPFAYMDGVWRGSAWTIVESGEKHNITQTERIGPFLDGSVKVIEGRGYGADGKVSFNAFGIISYRPEKRGYVLHSHAMGYAGDFVLTPTADGYVWEIPAGPMTIHYSAVIKDGTWREVGDRILPGKEPIRFFEMNLTRVGSTTWPAEGAISPK